MAEKKKTTTKVVKKASKKVEEKKTMNRNVVYILYSIGIIISIAFAQYFTMREIPENVLASIEYEQQHSINYRVFYEDNQFYDQLYLGKGETFVSSLVDEIEVDFNYHSNLSDEVDLSYTYDVNATLYINEPGKKNYTDKPYLKKEYLIKDDVTVNLADKREFNVKDTTVIDFDTYREVYEKYKTESRLSVDAFLVLTFKVDPVSVTYPGVKDFKYNAVLSVEIPVSENTFQISEDHRYLEKKQVEKNAEYDEADKLYSLIVAALLWFLGILLALFALLTYRNDVKKQGEYARTLKKILSTYDNIIVDVEKLPVLSDLSVVNVTTFEELVDAQSEVRLPINFKEDKKKKVSKFILVRNNLAWVYTLKEGEEGEKN